METRCAFLGPLPASLAEGGRGRCEVTEHWGTEGDVGSGHSSPLSELSLLICKMGGWGDGHSDTWFILVFRPSFTPTRLDVRQRGGLCFWGGKRSWSALSVPHTSPATSLAPASPTRLPTPLDRRGTLKEATLSSP